MKRIRLYIVMIIGLVLLSQSCEEGFIPSDRDELIVEGWIDAGGFPVVMITHSLPVRLKEEGVKVSQIAKFMETSAKVTVSDGETSVTLTGKLDEGYFPPYIYTTSRLRGEAGKSYTLTVQTKDRLLTANTTIPLDGPVVDSVVCHELEGSDTLCSVLLYLKNLPDRKEYFKTFFQDGAALAQFRSTYLGVIDDAIADSTIKIPIMRTIRDDFKEDKRRYFNTDSLLNLKVATMDSVSFSFWKMFSGSTISSYSGFLMSSSIENLPTNVLGGIGYWCGYNPYISTFTVTPGTYPGNHPLP